jgi:1-deoxy-D-xylulose-5-phosphate reductoisomerase
MGRKITIDSATLMNKALEVIEAHWLFGLSADKIDVIIHPQSIVHSFVEFVDGSVLAQLGPPDMRTPIQYALTWPHRAEGCSRSMDWSSLRQMNFEPVDHARFPVVQLAYEVIRQGGRRERFSTRRTKRRWRRSWPAQSHSPKSPSL